MPSGCENIGRSCTGSSSAVFLFSLERMRMCLSYTNVPVFLIQGVDQQWGPFSFARVHMCHECSGALFFCYVTRIRSGGCFHTSRACAKVSACAIWAINFAVDGGVQLSVHCFDHFVTTEAERLLCVHVEWSWLNSSRVLSDIAHEKFRNKIETFMWAAC